MTTAAVTAAALGVAAYVDLARPFTLVAPALGFMSGALTAVGAAPREPWSAALLVAPLIGSAMAALLNAGNNALNQIYDLEIDRVNKPKRPLPSGRLTIAQAWRFTNVTYALALVLAWLVAPGGGTNASGWSLSRWSAPTSTRCRRSGPSGSASGRTSRSRFRAACC